MSSIFIEHHGPGTVPVLGWSSGQNKVPELMEFTFNQE